MSFTHAGCWSASFVRPKAFSAQARYFAAGTRQSPVYGARCQRTLSIWVLSSKGARFCVPKARSQPAFLFQTRRFL